MMDKHRDAICVVDYGLGNSASVANMLRFIGVEAAVTSSPAEVAAASALILPGVGSFDTGMRRLRLAGLDEAIREAVLQGGARLLGICLGMQMLLDDSEEGDLPGLSLIPGHVRRLAETSGSTRYRIPHMGWNVVTPVGRSPLFRSDEPEWRFYFVHSFAAHCLDAADVLARSSHGQTFTCAVGRGSVFGVQFHPVKSHRFGKALLSNFAGPSC